jgi:hypothetical protein
LFLKSQARPCAARRFQQPDAASPFGSRLEAAILAKANSAIPFAELNSLVPQYCEPEDIEDLFVAMSAEGIWIVDWLTPRFSGVAG